MTDNNMFSLLDILITGSGLYLLYCWYLLMFKGEVREGVLLPNKSNGKCRDIEGYRKAIGKKLLVLSLTALAAGGLGLYSDYVKPINTYLYLALTLLFLIVLILFVRTAKKAEKEFF